MTRKAFTNESIEISIIKKRLTITISLYVFIILLFLIISLSSKINIFWSLFFLYSFILLPFIIYYLYRFYFIISNYKNYDFLDVKFKDMHSGFRSLSYFSLDIDYNGKIIQTDTRNIFSSRLFDFIYPNYEEYLNHNVKIAFNRLTYEVVVIKSIN